MKWHDQRTFAKGTGTASPTPFALGLAIYHIVAANVNDSARPDTGVAMAGGIAQRGLSQVVN